MPLMRASPICADDRAERSRQRQIRAQPLVCLRRHRREVDGVADDAFLQKVTQRGGGLAADLFLRLFRGRSDVRRGHDLRQRGKAPVLGGSGSKTSRPAPADVALLDGVGQRRLVNQLAARGINDADALLAPREAAPR